MTTPPEIQINAVTLIRRGFIALIGLELWMGLMDFTFAYMRLSSQRVVQRLNNLAREDGVGTWFASSQALLVGLVLFGLASLSWRPERREALGWGLLASFFTYVSMDDALSFHERVGGALRRATYADGAEWFPSYSWQLMFGPLFGAMGLFMVWFLARRLAPNLRPWLAIALSCFVLAVGLDFVEGLDEAFASIADVVGVSEYTVSHGSKVTEELLEMAGTTSFLAMFSLQLVASLGGRRIVLAP
ncbi:MAG TPA: hypothetical protein ENK18_11305 [Deltaproteobacteria bacterium]|nr:hypothetical protein [Deltaproteobacteria bacterium]